MTQIGATNPYSRNTPYTGQARPKAAPAGHATYAEALRTGQAEAAAQTGHVKTAADMTMEEYKSYIHNKLSQIQRHPSQAMDTVSINISEAGFEAMKNDPEYEQYIFDSIAKDFAVNNPWTGLAGGCYCVYNIGATKEENSAQSWYAGYQNGKGKDLYHEKSKNNFWERRAEMHAESMRRSAELAQMRHMAELVSEEMTEWKFGDNKPGTFIAGMHSTTI